MQRPLTLSLLALGAIFSVVVSNPVPASTSRASFTVSTTVQAGCSVSAGVATLQKIGLGQANWTTTPTVNCNRPVAYMVVISSGSGSGKVTLARTQFGVNSEYAGFRRREPFKLISGPAGDATWSGASASILDGLSSEDLNPVSSEPDRYFRSGAVPATLVVTIVY